MLQQRSYDDVSTIRIADRLRTHWTTNDSDMGENSVVESSARLRKVNRLPTVIISEHKEQTHAYGRLTRSLYYSCSITGEENTLPVWRRWHPLYLKTATAVAASRCILYLIHFDANTCIWRYEVYSTADFNSAAALCICDDA